MTLTKKEAARAALEEKKSEEYEEGTEYGVPRKDKPSALLAQVRGTPGYKEAFTPGFDPAEEWGTTTQTRGTLLYPKEGPEEVRAPFEDWMNVSHFGVKRHASAKENADQIRASIKRGGRRNRWSRMTWNPFTEKEEPTPTISKKQMHALLGYWERKEFEERELELKKRKQQKKLYEARRGKKSSEEGSDK